MCLLWGRYHFWPFLTCTQVSTLIYRGENDQLKCTDTTYNIKQHGRALYVFLLICAQGYFQNTPADHLICVRACQQLLSRMACRYDIKTFLSPRPLTGQKCTWLRNISISPSFAWLCTSRYRCINVLGCFCRLWQKHEAHQNKSTQLLHLFPIYWSLSPVDLRTGRGLLVSLFGSRNRMCTAKISLSEWLTRPTTQILRVETCMANKKRKNSLETLNVVLFIIDWPLQYLTILLPEIEAVHSSASRGLCLARVSLFSQQEKKIHSLHWKFLILT